MGQARTVKGDLYKSDRHPGLIVKVRSEIPRRHPLTADIIGSVPGVWCYFGHPTGEIRQMNPLSGEMDVFETFRGGSFSISATAEEEGWDDDVVEMVRRRLDFLCETRPTMVQRVDAVVEPAVEPWPTYDQMAATSDDEVLALVDLARTLGLVEKALAYERENENREQVVELLVQAAAESPDPEPKPEPVLAVTPKRPADELQPIILA